MIASHVIDITVSLDEYPTVDLTATLYETFKALTSRAQESGHRYRHALVLNQKGELAGIIGMRELLHGLFPIYLRGHEQHHFKGISSEVAGLASLWNDTCDEECPAAAKRPIRDFMGPIKGTLDSQDPISLAAYLMVTQQASLLPVTEHGRVIGVCRLTDVFEIANEHIQNESIHHGQ